MAISSFIRQRKAAIQAHELDAIAWLQVLSQSERERALNDLNIVDVPSGRTFCSIGRPVTHWFGVVEGLLKVSSDSSEGQTRGRFVFVAKSDGGKASTGVGVVA